MAALDGEGTPVVDITAGVVAMRADVESLLDHAYQLRATAYALERKAHRLRALTNTLDPETH